MTLSEIDQDGLSTIAAAEAQAALASGDTALAREKFGQAGAELEKSISSTRKQSEKHLIRFLAATQYYKGGHYQKSLDLCQKIEARLLSADVRPLFPSFFRDVKTRSSSGYENQVRRELFHLWQSKQHERILELFRDHPYVFPPEKMAFARAVICEELKKYRAAALFYSTAWRVGPATPELLVAPAAIPISLLHQKHLEEAWDYVCHQIEFIPNPVTFVVASLACFHRTSWAKTEDLYPLFEEQIRYFEEARRTFRELPPEFFDHPALRSFMAMGFEAAAFGALRLGQDSRAREISNMAVDFDPNSPGLLTARGMVTYPDGNAVADFLQAVSLGETSYFPYYYLAHNALVKGDFPGAFTWCQKALERGPGRRIESQLYGWMAICRDQLGAQPEEVEALFRKSMNGEPNKESVAANYRLFKESSKSRSPSPPTKWDPGQIPRYDEEYLFDRESRLSEAFDRNMPIHHELQAIGS